MANPRVEAISALVQKTANQERRRQENEFLLKIQSLPADTFPDSTPLSQLVSYTQSEEVISTDEADKFNEYLSRLGLSDKDKGTVRSVITFLSFPWVNGKPVNEVFYVIEIGDVKEIIASGLLDKIDGFDNSLYRKVVEKLFN